MIPERIAETPWPTFPSRAEDLEQIWVPQHMLQDALRELVRDVLPGAAMLFGGLCIAQGVVLYAVQPQNPGPSMLVTLAVGTFLWISALALFQFKLALPAANPVAFSIALAAVGVSLSNLGATGEPLFTGPLFLFLAATSMLFLERRWFIGFSLTAIGLWLLVGLKVYSNQEWPYYVLSVLFVVGITAWLFFSRYSTLKRLTQFQLQDEKRRELLLGRVDHAYKSSAELMELTVRDPLTGAYNRRYLSRLRKEVEVDDRKWAAVLIDMDGFKKINDEFGHDAGDKALQKMAHFIRRQGRAEDRLIRIGGDEFLILIQVKSSEEVGHIAKRFREIASREAPYAFSMGSAYKRPYEPLEELLHRADRAMYQDKAREHRYDNVGVERS